MESQRFFIKDFIFNGNTLDKMFIEVSHKKYKEWNSKQTYSNRVRDYENNYMKVSLNALESADCALEMYHATICDDSFEKEVGDRILIEEIREMLSMWKPWAVEVYDYLYNGSNKDVKKALKEKYEIEERAFFYRTTELKKIVKKFLK